MKRRLHSSWKCTLGLLTLLIWTSDAPCAGKLDAFEADANPPSERVPRDREHHSHNYNLDGSDASLSEIFALGLLYGGMCSWERVTAIGQYSEELLPRAIGEPLIPFARVDVGYQNVESDVSATDVRAEGGYGPIGIHFDATHYRESNPHDTLDVSQILGLYRMSFGSHVETDLGFGSLTLDGKRTTSSFLFSLPLLVHPSEYWGIELRPAWANRVSAYDVAWFLTFRCASFKAGYRWVDTPNESLDGPYVGFSLRL